MWKRWRSRSLAPRRPVVFRAQWPLVVLAVLLLVAGLAAVVVGLLEASGSVRYPGALTVVD